MEFNEYCWRCGSPFHRRPHCTEPVTEAEAEVTKREIRRFTDIGRPAPGQFTTIPDGMPLALLSKIMDTSREFYEEAKRRLGLVGRPGISVRDAYEGYRRHKEINFKIHKYRQTDDKMVPAILKVNAKMGISRFGSEDEMLLFKSKAEDMTISRNRAWETTCRLLVWCKSATLLTKQRIGLYREILDWMTSNKGITLGRPTEHILVLQREVQSHKDKLDEYKKVVTEMRRICHVRHITEIDSQLSGLAVQFEAFITQIATQKDQWEMQSLENRLEGLKLEAAEELNREREERRNLESMIICSICSSNKKELMLMCGHTFCEECIVQIETHANDPPVWVHDGVGIDWQPLEFEEMPARAECPLCKKSLTPRVRIFF